MDVEFHKHYLDICVRYAADHSKDTSSQNGALLIDHQGFVKVRACNTFPFGVEYRASRMERPTKYAYFEHAERNAILLAARNGICTNDLVMYCPWAACADCARAIIQSGIRRLVRQKQTVEIDRWKQSCEHGDIMFREAGVEVIEIEGQISTTKILRDGKLITP